MCVTKCIGGNDVSFPVPVFVTNALCKLYIVKCACGFVVRYIKTSLSMFLRCPEGYNGFHACFSKLPRENFNCDYSV